jgi:hypothetical protein
MLDVAAAPAIKLDLLLGLAPALTGAVFLVFVTADLAKRHTFG